MSVFADGVATIFLAHNIVSEKRYLQIQAAFNSDTL
jgi:hypothetical protein